MQLSELNDALQPDNDCMVSDDLIHAFGSKLTERATGNLFIIEPTAFFGIVCAYRHVDFGRMNLSHWVPLAVRGDWSITEIIWPARVWIRGTIEHWIVCHFNVLAGTGVLYDSCFQQSEMEERSATLSFMHMQVCRVWPQFNSIPRRNLSIMTNCPQQPYGSKLCGICCMMFMNTLAKGEDIKAMRSRLTMREINSIKADLRSALASN